MNWYRMPPVERPESCARMKVNVVETPRHIVIRSTKRIGAWPAVFRDGHQGIWGVQLPRNVAKLMQEVA
jgi:hypothetical protein